VTVEEPNVFPIPSNASEENSESIEQLTPDEEVSPGPVPHSQDPLIMALITVVISDLHVAATVRGNAALVLDSSTKVASKSLDALSLVKKSIERSLAVQDASQDAS
jgi:hypothetical protein